MADIVNGRNFRQTGCSRILDGHRALRRACVLFSSSEELSGVGPIISIAIFTDEEIGPLRNYVVCLRLHSMG